jgi:acetyl-CoA carboxylase carboxyl transferase subunit alpha
MKTPIITIIIGEGASGGALGIGVGNKVYMMENTWYSVIAPESCSSIFGEAGNTKKPQLMH